MSLSVSRSSLPLDFSRTSFLVVDDQPFSRRLVLSMLLGFGSREVYESENGVEAFELARSVMPNIIITDLVMPIFDGLRFIKMVKDVQSPVHKTPIIVLSGYLTKAAALMVRNSGADELLVKPVSPKSLYDHIVRIVLQDDSASQQLTLLQSRKRRTTPPGKKADGLAYV
ncbi:MAG TPA: response regulator [Xanthobacteraceae bacterium]|jgi:two-component system chemotaxis response regulator CheY|nr:response regulator [Xanthobacteraceae bacterium]